MKNNFKYNNSTPLTYNGCYFHSKLELKYALSIETDYYYIREPVIIPFDPSTHELPKAVQSRLQYYVPDFLIRHKTSGQALLIEVKPAAFNKDDALLKRKKLANAYIKKLSLDWTYLLITENDISLSPAQLQKLNTINRAEGTYIRSFFSIIPTNHGTGLSPFEFIKMMKSGLHTTRRMFCKNP